MKWRALVLGQVLALLVSGTGISGSLLVRFGISAPLFQLFWFYLVLLIVFVPVTLVAVKKNTIELRFKRSLLAALASISDTQGNFVTILSYTYTTVTSVSVLVQSSFLSAAVLSYVVAHKRYSLWEYIGLVICVCGIVAIVVLDLRAQGWRWTGDAVGDAMALLGGILFSVTSVFQEKLMKNGTAAYEYLAHIATLGVPIMALEGWLLEGEEILSIHTWPQIAAVALFAVCYSGFYAGMPFYIQYYGATLFNMSLVPNIVYTLIFAALAYHEDLDFLYIGALFVVVIGLVVYNLNIVRRYIVRTPPLIESRKISLTGADGFAKPISS